MLELEIRRELCPWRTGGVFYNERLAAFVCIVSGERCRRVG